VSCIYSPILRRALAVILLLTSLFVQLQVAYACELLDGAPLSATCCCGEEMAGGCIVGGGCTAQTMDSSSDCCATSFEAPANMTAAAPVAQSHAIALLDAPQAPSAVPLLSLAPCTAAHRTTTISFDQPAAWLAGTRTYLITQRFRS